MQVVLYYIMLFEPILLDYVNGFKVPNLD